MWAFKQLWDKGLVYEGYRVMPYSWAAQTPLSNFETRLDNSYRERQDPAITCASGCTRAAREPALDLLVWTTTPWTLPSNLALAVGPEIEYAIFDEGRGAHRARRGRRREATRASSRARRASAACAAPSSSAARTRRSSRSSPTTPNAFRVLGGATSSTPTRAPASCTWRRASARTTWPRVRPPASRSSCPSTRTGRFTREVPALGGPARLRREPADHPRPEGARRARAATTTIVHNYPHCWRTDTPLIYRAMSSWYVKVTAIRDRMVELQPADQLDPGARPRRAVRQVARGRARLVDQPQPLLGLADPGVAQRRPALPAHRRLRLARRARARLRRAARRPAPARRSTQLVRPNPDDPTGKAHDAPRPRRARLLVRVGLDAVRAGALPVREPRVVREPLPGRLHRRVRRADARLVLHDARAGDGAVRPPAVPELHLPRRGARRERRRSSPSACATTRAPRRSSRRYGADALRWFLCQLADPARRSTCRSTARARRIREVVRLVLQARSGTPTTSSASTRTPTACARAAQRRARACSTATSSPRRATSCAASRRALDAYDIPGACARDRELHRRAQQLVHPPQPRPLLGRATEAPDKRDAYDTLYTVLVTLLRVGEPAPAAALRRRSTAA